MNTIAISRKLHNTVSALMFSGAVLVLGVVAAHPGGRPTPGGAPQLPALALDAATAPGGPIAARADAPTLRVPSRADRIESLAGATAFTAELATAVALTSTLEHAAAAEPVAVKTAPRSSGKPSRIRQSMAMPYFSFVSRG